MPYNFSISSTLLQILRAGDAERFQAWLRSQGFLLPSRKFETFLEFTGYVKSVNLKTLFGTGEKCCCMFHNDRNPSAGIFQAPGGDWLYQCYSSNCRCGGRAMNLIQIVQEWMGAEKKEVYAFLLKSFNATLKEKEKRAKINLFRENLNVLAESFQKQAPTAFRLADREALKALYQFGLEQTGRIDSETRKSVTISVSNKQLREQAGAKYLKVSCRLAQFAFFGLIHRVAMYELSEERYGPMMEHFKEEKRSSPKTGLIAVNQIQLFRLTEQKLEEAECNAKRWVQLKYCLTNFTYRVIYEKEGSFRAHELMPGGGMVYVNQRELRFREFKKQIIRILEREIAQNGSVPLQKLKELLHKGTGGSPKMIQLYLKPILDKLCEGKYDKIRCGRWIVIIRRTEETELAA